MIIIGGLFMAVGAIIAAVMLQMDTGVAVSGISGIYGSSTVANLSLMQSQMMGLHIAIGLFVSGSILVGLGFVIEAIQKASVRGELSLQGYQRVETPTATTFDAEEPKSPVGSLIAIALFIAVIGAIMILTTA